MHARPRRSTRLLLALLASSAIVVAGCSSSGGDDDAGGGTTTTEVGTTPTTGADATTTTEDGTTTTTDGDQPAADLEAVLPAATDVGPDYREVPSDDDDDSSPEADAALEAACPEATELADDEDDESGDVSRTFETEDGRTVEVTVGPADDLADEDELDQMIAAVNDCDVIEYEEDGMALTMRIAAERDDQHGDLGVRFFFDVTGEHPSLTAPVEIRMEGATYLVGRHSFEVMVGDGVTGSGNTPETVPGDYELVDSLAAGLQADLEALTD